MVSWWEMSVHCGSWIFPYACIYLKDDENFSGFFLGYILYLIANTSSTWQTLHLSMQHADNRFFFFFLLFFVLQKRLLATAHNQIDSHKAGIASRRAEMETQLVDSLTPEQRSLLSSLNPEITQLKEQLIECKARRMDVRFFWILYLVKLLTCYS